MKVLLLGGKGYVGSRLYPILFGKGYSSNNSVIDLCWFGDHTFNGFIYKDFNNITINELYQYDAVVLLAAHSSVKMCINHHYASFNNNVRNFVSLVNKIKQTNKPIKLIYASSSSVYGNTGKELADETKNNFVCVNNYDLTKYTIDQYMINNNPIPCWYGLRFGTINGFSRNFRSELMLNSMTKSALDTGKIQISNSHINRAILDLGDLCDAVVQILEVGSADNSGVYNVNSFNSNVADLAKEVSELTGAEIVDNGNVGNPYDFMISNKKFETTFNFKFKGSVERIVNEIKQNYENIHFTDRDRGVEYE